MEKLTSTDIVNIVETTTNIIIENEKYFCDLDSVAGDGDFGMSLAKGFKIVKNEWNDLSKNDIGDFLKQCGMIITEHCGGASGPIWGTAFRTAGKYAKGKTELNVTELGELLQSFIDGVQKRGGAQLGDKTLLDALIPAAEGVKECAKNGDDIATAMRKAADEAVKGAEKTKEISARKGRASYVGDRSKDHPDAGAMAIGIIFKGIVEKFLK